MTTLRVIDFQDKPFGRFRSDGPQSGQAFREDDLIPALFQIILEDPFQQEVIIDMTGYNRYGSSWIEEVFGGMRRIYPQFVEMFEIKPVHRDLPSLELLANKFLKGVL